MSIPSSLRWLLLPLLVLPVIARAASIRFSAASQQSAATNGPIGRP